MSINLGAFLSPLIVGSIANFHIGFAIAAVGMFFGLIVFGLTKKKNLGLAGTMISNPLSPAEKKKTFTIFGLAVIIIAALCAVLIPKGLLTFC
jgi:POT family proton-dependent oligopeptide transporter